MCCAVLCRPVPCPVVLPHRCVNRICSWQQVLRRGAGLRQTSCECVLQVLLHCCADPTPPHPWYTCWYQSTGASPCYLLHAPCPCGQPKDLQSVVIQRSRECCYPKHWHCQAEMGAVGMYKRSVCRRGGADHRQWWLRTVLSKRQPRAVCVCMSVGGAPFESSSCVCACVLKCCTPLGQPEQAQTAAEQQGHPCVGDTCECLRHRDPQKPWPHVKDSQNTHPWMGSVGTRACTNAPGGGHMLCLAMGELQC